jgi:hypothetical protein
VTPYDYAGAYVHALTGSMLTPMSWRAIHDRDKGAAAIPFDGPLDQVWQSIEHYNQQGYGIFAVPSVLDGTGRKLENVVGIRAHYIDLDTGSIEANLQRADASEPAPCFSVQSSPGKHHVYWPIQQQYRDNARFETLQRKLTQTYGSDPKIIDATRVMRVPGTWSHKYEQPHFVTCTAMRGYLQPSTIEQLEYTYSNVQVIDGGSGERMELGDSRQSAPSLEWIEHALKLIDPNGLDRLEWIAITAAIKQAGWSLTDDATLFAIWSKWCEQYGKNDLAENRKQWLSIRNTELGWQSLVRRLPSLRAGLAFGTEPAAFTTAVATPPMPVNAPPPLDCSGEMLTAVEQQEYFKGCVWVTKLGQILVPDGRFLNASQFNGSYGGKQFVYNSAGKQTDEAWKAALRGTQWRIPSVDHVRFLPHEPHGTIVKDDLGRKGVNTYKPAQTRRVEGDAGPFLRHIAAMLPDERDQSVLIAYLAHNVRYPGHKIPWAPVIQSVEGVGKGIIKELMLHALGRIYTHYPNAQELTNSGSTFNGWMRNKLFILADEIKVDDRRDLIEVLKPMISESLIEVQSKGVDQELEDNYANWLFFTNYKDAVPISKNGRRYAVFYSPIQTEADLLARGMGEDYFNALYGWMKADGAAIVTDWLHRYPIERGAIPMRAPKTSSWDEAVKIGRSPVERVIQEAVDDQIPGFRGGWVSVLSCVKRIRAQGAARGNVPPHVIAGVLETLGYVASGRAPRMFMQDDPEQITDLFHVGQVGDVSQFGRAQGWE